jgi:hypothetical protein
MAFSANSDGSTKWIFAQLSAFNGFAVVDFATHKEIKRIKNPDLPPGKSEIPEGADPSHGMAVTPDQGARGLQPAEQRAVHLLASRIERVGHDVSWRHGCRVGDVDARRQNGVWRTP